MRARVLQVGPSPTDVLLRSPVNWPVVVVAVLLGTLHLAVALYHADRSTWTTGVAAAIGMTFLAVALGVAMTQRDVEISVTRGYIRTRRGFGRFARERAVPFTHVHGVRLTQIDHHGHHQSQIELLCERGDIPCPTTDMPRQQALLMAMALNVRLIKVWQSSTPILPEERVHELFRAESSDDS